MVDTMNNKKLTSYLDRNFDKLLIKRNDELDPAKFFSIKWGNYLGIYGECFPQCSHSSVSP